MKKENLLFVVTDKTSSRPKKMGNARKCAWTSPRWVNYHIGRNRWSRPGDPHPATNYNVHIINLNDGTMKVISGIAFVESTKNPEVTKAEIFNRFGFAVDLQTLHAMHLSNVFNDSLKYDIREYLIGKGINC